MKRKLLLTASVIYLIIAIWLLFFFPFTHASRLNPNAQRSVNLMPFKNTSKYIQQAWHYQNMPHTRELLMNIGGNILLFVPFGLIICYTGVGRRAFLIGLLSSFTVESIQLLTQVGNFDVDDMIWNTAGTLIGFFLIKRYNFSS